MNTDELKEMIKSTYPTVWKTSRLWLVNNQDVYEVGKRLRDSLVRKGFRSINDDEDIKDTLSEAEKYFKSN